MCENNIEFNYICHKCEKKIKATRAEPNTAKMILTGKKFEYVFECEGGCSKDINEVERVPETDI